MSEKKSDGEWLTGRSVEISDDQFMKKHPEYWYMIASVI